MRTGICRWGRRRAEAMQLSAEQALEEKLIATLEPVTGAGNVRASVTLNYDPAATDETEETYDPDQTVTLSMQRNEQTHRRRSRWPPEFPARPRMRPTRRLCPSIRSRPPLPQTAKSESGTYGASKTVRHVVEGPGKVRRLTAAIVVNDRHASTRIQGQAAHWQPRSADELRNLTALAQAAVGFDATRGDMLQVEDLAFEDNRLQTAGFVAEAVAGQGRGLAGCWLSTRPCWPAFWWWWPSECVPRCAAPGRCQWQSQRSRKMSQGTAERGEGRGTACVETARAR